MVGWEMMFGAIITKILLARVPCYDELFIFYLVEYPEIPHFHGTRFLLFDCFVCDSYGCGIVDVCGHWWLRVAHVS